MKNIYLILIAVLLFYCGSGHAQSTSQPTGKEITGIVLDDLGESVIGASLIIKGTNVGTMTDFNGNFKLKVEPNSTIIVSYIGYETQIVQTTPSTDKLEIVLKEDILTLDDVVVIGYGTARKRDLTGAISTIKAEKMEAEAPREITDLMRGTAGLNVGVSSSAKGALIPNIRGRNTLTAGADPTLVVDGTIYYGSFSDINVNDVESIDVLKDASSAAVYGSQAANGVIVITTKKGKSKDGGKPLITFNSNIGFVQSANQMKVLNGEGYLKYRQDYEIQKNGKEYLEKYPEMFTNPFELEKKGINKLDWYNYSQKDPVTSVTDEELTRTWLSRLELFTPEIDNYMAGIETDWADLVLRKGFQQDYTIGISSSTDNTKYHWSLGYVDREGIIVGDEYKNIRTRLNLDTKVTNFLSVGMNTNFSVRDESSQDVSWGAMRKNSPYASNNLGDPNSEYRYYVAGDPLTTNPLYLREYRDKSYMIYSLNSNLYAKLKLPFDIQYQVNFTPYMQWQKDYYHQYSSSENETNNGSSSRTEYMKYHWTVDNIINWKKELAPKHEVDVTLLANAEKRQTWSTTASTKNYSPSDVLGYHYLEAGLIPNAASNDTYSTGDALMGRLFYSYDKKYMLTTSVRRDGYSAFGANNKRAIFPSVALGYILTSEKFMQRTANWFNYGKLRFSWGQNGNRDIGQYDALSGMQTNDVTYIDSNGIVYPSVYMYVNSMANKSLKWERTESYNLGFDFSFFNDIISGNIDMYKGTTKDLLVARSLPNVTGYSTVMANLGELQNKGLEVTLNSNIIKTPNFTWSASASFWLNRRKLIALYGEFQDILDDDGNVIGQKEKDDPNNGWFIGEDPERIWGYNRLGVWQLGEEEEAAKYGCKPGDFKYEDINEDGTLDSKDKILQGYTTPRFRWSLRNDFTIFKDFMFSFSMYSYIGHYGTFNEAANYNEGQPHRFSSYDIPRWTEDNPTNDYARISSYNAGNNWVNKTFVRLDNISLSYNVPKSFLRKFSIQNMRLTLSGRNIAVWSPDWTFWDPQNGSLSPRTFNFGVNFSL